MIKIILGFIIAGIIWYLFRLIYYYIRDERMENFKRKHCTDDAIESHFGCSKEMFYKRR